MHHTFCIEEILLNVFSYCCTFKHRHLYYSLPEWQCWYANVHLTALARTCKTFKGPALDMIWAELDDLTPLIRCLPEASWVRLKGVRQSRSLVVVDADEISCRSIHSKNEQTDWDVILGYAHRVRALPRLHGSFGLAADCIEALSNPPSPIESIFPNLRIVGLENPSAKFTPLMRHLTNPKLTSISFEEMENLDAAIDAFGKRCPLVTDFEVLQRVHTDTTSDLICRWKDLRSVQCLNVDLNIDALSHLSRLHNLLDMCFGVHNAVVDRIHATLPPAFTLTFPTLDYLCLTSGHLTPIWRLLSHFRTPEVHELTVGLLARVRPPAPDLMSFFFTLREACTHDSLNHLSLRVCDGYNESNDIPMENASPYCITFNRLRPLTVFVNIKSITLDIYCGMDLNEQELLCLVSSWPHLETFEVGEEQGWLESSAITPRGFLQLLERCRSLRELSFMFDCRGYTEIPQGHPWRGLTMPKHTSIKLLDSTIEEESIEALSVFFHVAPYPDFRLTTHWDNRCFNFRDRFCDLYCDRWAQVRILARDLWQERKDLRRSLELQSSWDQS